MQAFSVFLDTFGLRWFVPVIAVLIFAGVLSQVSSWIVGPSKGLFATSRDGSLPPFFQKVNKNGVATNLLLVQGGIVTALSFMFLFMPNVNSSYWILTVLTIQLYLIMYVLMFAAALRLRYSRPEVKRAYRIPGGNPGMWLVAGIGILGAIFAIFIGFFPPAQIATGNIVFYEVFLVSGIIAMCLPPIIIHFVKKPEWAGKE
jgi:amino acid transporter